jgi:hypothetical protein
MRAAVSSKGPLFTAGCTNSSAGSPLASLHEARSFLGDEVGGGALFWQTYSERTPEQLQARVEVLRSDFDAAFVVVPPVRHRVGVVP